MAFEPGHKLATGRPKGSKNKSIGPTIQEMFDRHRFNPLEHLLKTIKELKPSQQADICLSLMQYTYAKPKFEQPLVDDDKDSDENSDALAAKLKSV